MAASKNNRSNPSNTETQQSAPAQDGLPPLPPGYEEVADDLVGYWNPDLHKMIHVVPKEAKVFDGNIDKSKPAILIFAKLVDSAILGGKDENKNDIKVEGKPGDMIGIWGKPGLKQKLMQSAGIDVFICPNGEKDTGKGNPMKLFSVRARKGARGAPLPLVEDRREYSKYVETWWHRADGSAINHNDPPDQIGGQDFSDVPI